MTYIWVVSSKRPHLTTFKAMLNIWRATFWINLDTNEIKNNIKLYSDTEV